MEDTCSNGGDKDVGFIRDKVERRAIYFFQFNFLCAVRKFDVVIISSVSLIVTLVRELKNPRKVGIKVSFEEYFKLFDTEVMKSVSVTDPSFLGTGW